MLGLQKLLLKVFEINEETPWKNLSVEQRQLILYGNTKMISNIDTLICDSMIYWLDKDSLFAFGNVKLTQNNRKLNSDKLNFWKTNGYRGASFIADGNVNVFDNDKMIEADIISYSDSTQIMGLESGAKVISNNRKLFGENIQINFIDSLISSNACFIFSRFAL